MGRQRRIVDLLAARGGLCIEVIARELGEDPDRIKASVLKMRYHCLVRVTTRSASLDGALVEGTSRTDAEGARRVPPR